MGGEFALLCFLLPTYYIFYHHLRQGLIGLGGSGRDNGVCKARDAPWEAPDLSPMPLVWHFDGARGGGEEGRVNRGEKQC